MCPIKGFKSPKTFFAIKYYIIEIKTLCFALKNNYFKQKKSFESKIIAFEDKKSFPSLVKFSSGLPLVAFSFGPYYEGKMLHCKQK